MYSYTNDIQDRVQRGVEVLDEHVPGWELKIDFEKFRMDDCHACIVGQVIGEYGEGLYHLELVGPDDNEEKAAGECGFTTLYPDQLVELGGFVRLIPWEVRDQIRIGEWMALEAEWTKVVKERLDAGIAL